MRSSNKAPINKGGRPKLWVKDHALPHAGALHKEPVDCDGLFQDEHEANVAAVEQFTTFAPVGAGAADRAIADLGLGVVEKQKACGNSRLDAQRQHEEHKDIADGYKKAMLAPLVENTLGTFFQQAFYGGNTYSDRGLVSGIIATLNAAATHEPTATAPHDPTVGQVVATPEEKMKVINEGLEVLKHKLAEAIYTDALESNEKMVKMYLTRFRGECDRARELLVHLRIATELTETIKSARIHHPQLPPAGTPRRRAAGGALYIPRN